MAKIYIGMGDIATFMPNDERLALFRNNDGNYVAQAEHDALEAANAAMEDVEFEGENAQSASHVQKRRAWAHYLNEAHTARGTSVPAKYRKALEDEGVEPFVTDEDAETERAAAAGEVETGEAPASYAGSTKAELRALAEKRGLVDDGHVKKSMTKDELVHQLQLADRRDRGK